VRRRLGQRAQVSTLLRSGLFDREFYQLQVPERFRTRRAAARHYVTAGEPSGLAPNRLFAPEWYRAKSRTKSKKAIAAYLRSEQASGWTSPHFHAPTYGGSLGQFLASATDETLTCPKPGSGVTPVPWGQLKRRLDAAARVSARAPGTTPTLESLQPDWAGMDEAARRADLVSVLIPTYEDWAMTTAAVQSVLANSDDTAVEVVVLDNGSRPSVFALLTSCFAGDERVRIERAPINTNFATGSNLAFAASAGSVVVFLNNDTEVLPGWLAPLRVALDDEGIIGAQPLLLYPDGSIQSAGTLFLGSDSIPIHFLTGHPVEDLPPGATLDVPAVTAACVALRASDVMAARGFDPVYVNGMEDVDLCLRLAELRRGGYVVCTASRVIHHESKTPGRHANIEANRREFFRRWDGRLPDPDPEHWTLSGFTVTGYSGVGDDPLGRLRKVSKPLLAREARLVAHGPAAGLPSLRWALKIAAYGGPRGDIWGDVAFAEDLAHGLRELGQEVVIDRRGAHVRPGSDHLDDVVVHLRGLVPAAAQAGATNVLWVISHPDLVGDEELSPAFDLVYSAGPAWSDVASERSGREVRTLLQATNAGRFRPDGPAMPGLDVLFVGRTRGVYRPVVHDAIEVGAQLSVYGMGWRRLIDPSFVKADELPNDRLPSAYRGARIVLNDHWPDMARLGFLSNRLFDAAATGVKVVTDPVAGLADVFGASVRAYHSLEELKLLLHPDSDLWADEHAILDAARHVATEHSFTARARTLLADVLDVRGVEHGLR
jgi:GT2 family glycosyltransferase